MCRSPGPAQEPASAVANFVANFVANEAAKAPTVRPRPCANISPEFGRERRGGELAATARQTPGVALTFDDGPDPVWTPRVLDALRRAGARATFFVVSPQAHKNPALIHAILDDGHAVGFHCAEHVRHTELTRAELEEDTRAGLRDLEDLGVVPRLWRTPWGAVTPVTKAVARASGMEIVPWTADPHDWRGDTAAEMLDHLKPLLEPGAIVLLHDGLGPGSRRAGCGASVALIGPLVESIRARGLEPVALTTPPPRRTAA